MSSSERSIPHLRDIFSINSYSSGYNYTTDHHHHQAALDNNRHHNASAVKPSSRKKRSGNETNYNKTLTNGDIKTLERHLSMKKTIRKKIMRDLQQMYTDDPNEFKTENREHLKAEVRADVVRFGERQAMQQTHKKSDNFLDMLRGENNYLNNNGNNYDATTNANNNSQKEKQSFWKRFTMKGKSNR